MNRKYLVMKCVLVWAALCAAIDSQAGVDMTAVAEPKTIAKSVCDPATFDGMDLFTLSGNVTCGSVNVEPAYFGGIVFEFRQKTSVTYAFLMEGDYNGQHLVRPAFGTVEFVEGCQNSGNISTENGCVDFRISLGQNAASHVAGWLAINTNAPSPELATPAGLQLHQFSDTLDVVMDNINSQNLAQVMSDECLVIIEPLTDYSYQVLFYSPNDVLGELNTNGQYQLTENAQPTRWYTIDNPNGSANCLTLRIVEQPGTNTYVYSFTAPSTWTLTTGNGAKVTEKTESEQVVSGITNRFVTTTVKNSSDDIVSQKTQLFQKLGYGEMPIPEFNFVPVTRSSTHCAEISSDGSTSSWTVVLAHDSFSKACENSSALRAGNGYNYVVEQAGLDPSGNHLLKYGINTPMRIMPLGQTEVELETIVDPDGLALKTTRTYYDGTTETKAYANTYNVAVLIDTTWGNVCSYQVQGIWSNYTLHTDGCYTGRYAHVASVEYPDGSWARYDYDGQGRKTQQVESWLDAEKTASAGAARETILQYTPVAGQDDGTVFRYSPRTIVEKVLGTEVSRKYFAYYIDNQGRRVEITEQASTPGAAFGDAANLQTITLKENTWDGRVLSVTHPDGRLDAYTYEGGDFCATNASPGDWTFSAISGYFTRETVIHTSSNSPNGVAFKSTKDVQIKNSAGHVFFSEQHVYDGSAYQRVSWKAYELDDQGRPLTVTSMNGLETEATWGCCGKESETDENGIEYSFAYDTLKRPILSVKQGVAEGDYPAQANIYMSYTYDAANRKLTESRSAGGITLVSSNQYDLAGRLVKTVDSAGLTTEYSYADGGRTETATLPGGITRIASRFKDGRLKSITGTAQTSRYYSYGVNEDGSLWTTVFFGASDSAAWEKTTTDMMGRLVKKEKPGYSGTDTESYEYNAKGQLTKETYPGTSPILLEYGVLGRPYRIGYDINGNGTLDFAGADRIMEADLAFEKTGTDWWLVYPQTVYAKESSSDLVTNSIMRKRLSGFSGDLRSELIVTDINGNSNVTQVMVDRNARKTTKTVQSVNSDIPAESVIVNGLTMSARSKTGHTTLCAYDALGRMIGLTDPRRGTNGVEYNSQGRIQAVTYASGARIEAQYEFTTGRLLAETDQAGRQMRYAYTARGLLEKQWGGAAMPVSFVYDDLDRLVELHTYRNGTGWTGNTWPEEPGESDRTAWLYAEDSGLLLAKDDAQDRRVSYTYYPGGKLATRMWARSLETTYGYSGAGELSSVEYNDNTPDVFIQRDRLGRSVSIADGQGTRQFTYNDTLQPATESIPYSGGTNVIERMYDEKGRYAGLSLKNGGAILSSSSFAYDELGRFNGISWSNSIRTMTAEYAYLTNSDLLAQTILSEANTVVQRSVSYESNRNRIASIQNLSGESLVSGFEYTSDVSGRTLSVKHSGGAFDFMGDAFTLFGYNAKSEITSADRYFGESIGNTNDPVLGQNYAYDYDNAGNRKTASRASQVETYTANDLNQYLQKTVPSGIDILGSAETNSTVTVNNESVTRHQKYWQKALAVTNSSDAVYQDVNVVGVYNPPGTNDPDVATSVTGHVFVAKTPEAFTYDDDGNLLTDGRFNYSWDGENRLISAETRTNLPAAVPLKKVEFTYDYASRRVSKTLYSGLTNNQYQITNNYVFLYDLWNVISESEICYLPSEIRTNVSSFVWGLDLSGSLQGAGGAGGLLSAFFGGASSTSSVFYCYDANGNVSELIDSQSGATAAHYEYGPFGELVVATGPLAGRNPFQFSTKMLEREFGLYYYGFRFFDISSARWLNKDPLGEKGGLNLYGFVGNNPIGKVDVLGLNENCACMNGPQGYANYKTAADYYTPSASVDYPLGFGDVLDKAVEPALYTAAACVPVALLPVEGVPTALLLAIGAYLSADYVGSTLGEAQYFYDEGQYLEAAEKFGQASLEPALFLLNLELARYISKLNEAAALERAAAKYSCEAAENTLKILSDSEKLVTQSADDILLGVVENGEVRLYKTAAGEIKGHADLVKQGLASHCSEGFSVSVKNGEVTAIFRNSALNPASANYNLPAKTTQQILEQLGAKCAKVYGNP